MWSDLDRFGDTLFERVLLRSGRSSFWLVGFFVIKPWPEKGYYPKKGSLEKDTPNSHFKTGTRAPLVWVEACSPWEPGTGQGLWASVVFSRALSSSAHLDAVIYLQPVVHVRHVTGNFWKPQRDADTQMAVLIIFPHGDPQMKGTKPSRGENASGVNALRKVCLAAATSPGSSALLLARASWILGVPLVRVASLGPAARCPCLPSFFFWLGGKPPKIDLLKKKWVPDAKLSGPSSLPGNPGFLLLRGNLGLRCDRVSGTQAGAC